MAGLAAGAWAPRPRRPAAGRWRRRDRRRGAAAAAAPTGLYCVARLGLALNPRVQGEAGGRKWDGLIWHVAALHPCVGVAFHPQPGHADAGPGLLSHKSHPLPITPLPPSTQ